MDKINLLTAPGDVQVPLFLQLNQAMVAEQKQREREIVAKYERLLVAGQPVRLSGQ